MPVQIPDHCRRNKSSKSWSWRGFHREDYNSTEAETVRTLALRIGLKIAFELRNSGA